MMTLFITVAAAFLIIFICVIFLGFSWFFTGKSRFRLGMCGRDPTKNRDKENGCESNHTCSLCSKEEETVVKKNKKVP